MPSLSTSPSLKTLRLPPTRDLGDLMRYWREIRGRNQLELSLDTLFPLDEETETLHQALMETR